TVKWFIPLIGMGARRVYGHWRWTSSDARFASLNTLTRSARWSPVTSPADHFCASQNPPWRVAQRAMPTLTPVDRWTSIEARPPSLNTLARSARPSPLKSPAIHFCASQNPPWRVAQRAMPKLAPVDTWTSIEARPPSLNTLARSARPSPLKSPADHFCASQNPPWRVAQRAMPTLTPVDRWTSIEARPASLNTLARSARPSPLKSPATHFCASQNPPWRVAQRAMPTLTPVDRWTSIEARPASLNTLARSARPSPLKSPATHFCASQNPPWRVAQ